MTSRGKRDQFRRVFANANGICPAKRASIANVTAFDPAQWL